MKSINHSSSCHQYIINNIQLTTIQLAFITYPKQDLISIFKQDGKRRERWRDDHNQDIKKINKLTSHFELASFLLPSRLHLLSFSRWLFFFSSRSIGGSLKSLSQCLSHAYFFLPLKKLLKFHIFFFPPFPKKKWQSCTLLSPFKDVLKKKFYFPLCFNLYPLKIR